VYKSGIWVRVREREVRVGVALIPGGYGALRVGDSIALQSRSGVPFFSPLLLLIDTRGQVHHNSD